MNHKHLFGFDNEKELIYIFKGYDFLNLTSSITEYFEKSPAQYTKHWGWYINDLNKIKLYLYPNRPSKVPDDNSDLIPKVIKWTKTGFDVNKFYDLYPELKNEFIKFLKKDV